MMSGDESPAQNMEVLRAHAASGALTPLPGTEAGL
jgi:hypothetical protein